MNAIDILIQYKEEFAIGLWTTFKLSMFIWGFGVVIGTIIGTLGARFKKAIGIPSKVLSIFLGAIPILVILFWLHYPLQYSLNIVIDGFYTTVFALSLVNLFLVADLIRNSLQNFPNQYILAAEVVGMNRNFRFFHIQLPLILRQVLPSILLIQVTMLQATLFASLISVDEIFRIAQRVNSQVYQPVEIYTLLAILFLIICLPLNLLAFWLKKRYSRNISET